MHWMFVHNNYDLKGLKIEIVTYPKKNFRLGEDLL